MCPPPTLTLQAEEGVAEEAVLSEGGHPHHLSCHCEYKTNTQTRVTVLIKGGTSRGEAVLGFLNLEAGRVELT